MKSPYNNHAGMSMTLRDLELPELPETLDTAEESFVRKPEFHITLLNFAHWADVIDKDRAEELKSQMVEEFYRFVGSQPLTDYELTGELRLVEAGEDNKTVVAMAAVRGIDKLFGALSAKIGSDIPVQPTHITLYTLPADQFGIAINSYEELAKISKPIELPAIQKVLS